MSDTILPDLPPNQRDALRNSVSAQKIQQAGDAYGGKGTGQQWLQAAQQSAQQNHIPLYYSEKTIDRESGWNPGALSKSSSASGLGQQIRSTAQSLGINPLDPIQSISGVGTLLGQIQSQTGATDLPTLTQGYVLGVNGLKKFQAGQSVKGEDQMPAVSAWLAKNGLGGLNTPAQSVQPQSSTQIPSALANLISSTQSKGALQMPNLDNLIDENQDDENQDEENTLSAERDKMINGPMQTASALQNI